MDFLLLCPLLATDMNVIASNNKKKILNQAATLTGSKIN